MKHIKPINEEILSKIFRERFPKVGETLIAIRDGYFYRNNYRFIKDTEYEVVGLSGDVVSVKTGDKVEKFSIKKTHEKYSYLYEYFKLKNDR